MSVKVIIVRGAACSGKTTICKELRDFDEKIVWLSIDRVKEIYSNFKDEALDEVHKSVYAILSDLLKREYTVLVDGIFKKPEYVENVRKIAREENASLFIYQLKCSLETLKERDKNRHGAKIWGPLGDDLVTSIYNTVEKNPIEDAILLNTEKLTLDECTSKIRQNLP